MATIRWFDRAATPAIVSADKNQKHIGVFFVLVDYPRFTPNQSQCFEALGEHGTGASARLPHIENGLIESMSLLQTFFTLRRQNSDEMLFGNSRHCRVTLDSF